MGTDIIQIADVDHEVSTPVFEHVEALEKRIKQLETQMLMWHEAQTTAADEALYQFISNEVSVNEDAAAV